MMCVCVCAGPRVVNSRSDHDKPWRNNMAPAGGKGHGAAGPGGGPGGVGSPGAGAGGAKKDGPQLPAHITGPDVELASQLHREMLEGSPKVQ